MVIGRLVGLYPTFRVNACQDARALVNHIQVLFMQMARMSAVVHLKSIYSRLRYADAFIPGGAGLEHTFSLDKRRDGAGVAVGAMGG
jgi:hypothetical protein